MKKHFRLYSISPNAIDFRKGFTVLEVIVAVFIFGCISAALVRVIATADRIRGRAIFVTESVILAQNEFERLRNAAGFKTEVLDCTYIATVNNKEYDIVRRILVPELEISNKSDIPEIEIAVKPAGADSGYIYFRFLQGFSW
jgi:prepilin-type N-terminal cleavage/methylation domain-containing protein